MAYGNESGVVVIDIVQKISLVVLNTADIGGSADPCQRVLRSPKRQDDLKRENEDKARSPSAEQVKCISFSIVIILTTKIVILYNFLDFIQKRCLEICISLFWTLKLMIFIIA